MHQILGGPDKYSGSHEQIAAAIREHCSFAPLDLQRLFEVTIFNFALGNGDAHRKNFSLLTSEDGTIALRARAGIPRGRVASAGGPDERRRDDSTPFESWRSQNAAAGPPRRRNPKGRAE